MAKTRPATLGDLEPITAIYNEAVKNSVATFDTEEKSLAQQEAWFEGHGRRSPILVVEEGGAVLGWASLSEWSDRCAYADTAELSIYLATEARGRGLGRQLMGALIEAGREAGLHVILSRVVEGNEASLRLQASFGFVPIGVMRQVGQKFGRRWDVHLSQLTLA